MQAKSCAVYPLQFAGGTLGIYDQKPRRFFAPLIEDDLVKPSCRVYCAGFELGVWRSAGYADHLMEWLPDYALAEEELRVDHGNMYVRMRQAAIRVYTSKKYEKRGEVGEITLHAVCRDFFGTVPISNRVFYKSSSNDVVKAFDMVHARLPDGGPVEIWLGESKLYTEPMAGVDEAIRSMKAHLDAGFLRNEKMLLGPQIPKSTPRYAELMALFESQASLDSLIANAIFVVLVAADSPAAQKATAQSPEYVQELTAEMASQVEKYAKETDFANLRVMAIFVPLAAKKLLVDSFDAKLKGIQA